MTGGPIPLVVWGSGPNSGKTHTCVGLARALSNRGLRVLPFKAITVVEPGTSAVLPFHVAAAREAWQPCMTPVVVRDEGGGDGTVEVLGTRLCRVALAGADTVDLARLAPEQRRVITTAVDDSLDEIFASGPDVVLIEGAGSPVDAAVDVANQHVVHALPRSPRIIFSSFAWLGGAAASLIGTYMLLAEDLRPSVRGYLLGSPMPGAPTDRWADLVATHTGMPLLGVVPRLPAYEQASRTESLDRLAGRWGDAMSQAVDLGDLLGGSLHSPAS